MRNLKNYLLLVILVAFFTPFAAAGESAKDDAKISSLIEVPYEKFVLKNGLTLIVHEDHKAPIVAVNVWYHVGSKNEKRGRTGFAHLFEHLMFNGTENFSGEYFDPMEKVGATDLNGTTNPDRTNYFQNVPVNAFDLALWMESDRMGHLLGAIDQAKLDEQRGVVQNEKRQGQNQPYGKNFEIIFEAIYPSEHPYSWTTIGSMEDLNAASLDDVKQWFRDYYGAANAVLVVAGDITAAKVKERVEHFFGDIPAGPPITRPEVWIAKRSGTQRRVTQDRVPQPRFDMVWNVPEWGSRDGALLTLTAELLTSGKSSRLYNRLVYRDQIASSVSSFAFLQEIAGQFIIITLVAPGQQIPEVESALHQELDRFLEEGPSQEELDRVRTRYLAGFVRGLERIGGFGGKSDLLAQNEVFQGSPDHYKKTLSYVEEATPADIKRVANEWLSDGLFVLETHPFPTFAASDEGADRSGFPEVGAAPAPSFPPMQRTTLSNGMKVILAERHTVPVVNMELILDAGYAADQSVLAGTASMTATMLDEGAGALSSIEISERTADLGAQIGSGAGLDSNSVSLSALKSRLEESLDLYAEIVLNPSFPEEELERQRRQRLAGIKREKASPVAMAQRVLPGLLYGEDHAYGNPFTGSGTEESTQKLSRADLVEFHRTWYRPNNATLVVVGDTSLEEIKPMLEERFGTWEAAEVPKKNIKPINNPEVVAVYLMDRPGAEQSVIVVGQLAPPTNNSDETAITLMNHILGGGFNSRLNMNLREDKHWSYGAGSNLFDAKGQRPYFFFAPVQTDKTKESMIEVQKELEEYLGQRRASEEELDRAKKGRTLTLPGRWETANAVRNSIREIVEYGLPEDYYEELPGNIQGTTLEKVHAAAENVLHPARMIWVVVGDLEKIGQGIRELNLGQVHLLDSDGKEIE